MTENHPEGLLWTLICAGSSMWISKDLGLETHVMA